MLNGKRYYASFPDEGPATRPQMPVSRELLDALAELERQFRQQIDQFRSDANLNAAPEH
jgi:hypothetical protein